MIKKFEQYNESIRDKMVGKSGEELEQAKKRYLSDVKERSENPKEYIETMLSYLYIIYGNRKQMINDLMDEGLDATDILVTIANELDLKELSESDQRYKMKIMKWIYNLVEKNIDKIDLSERIY